MDDIRVIREKLNKVVWDQHLDIHSLMQLSKENYIEKITHTQYVITQKGFRLMNDFTKQKKNLN